MNLLIDTHVFIWMMTDETRLSSARNAIAERTNVRWINSIVAWELAIKTSIGKITLSDPVLFFVSEGIRKAKGTELPIRVSHAAAVAHLPQHHTDPFDRLLVAQCQVESFSLVTADRKLSAYGVPIIW